MILRLDQKLAKKVHAGPLVERPAADNPYADWTVRLFTAARTQYVLFCNTHALYGMVFYGRGITDDCTLIARGIESLRETMLSDGLGLIFQNLVVPHTGEVRFAKALNRSVTGSVNELVPIAEIFLADGELAPADIPERLNDTPLSAVGDKKHSLGFPREAIKNMMGS